MKTTYLTLIFVLLFATVTHAQLEHYVYWPFDDPENHTTYSNFLRKAPNGKYAVGEGYYRTTESTLGDYVSSISWGTVMKYTTLGQEQTSYKAQAHVKTFLPGYGWCMIVYSHLTPIFDLSKRRGILRGFLLGQVGDGNGYYWDPFLHVEMRKQLSVRVGRDPHTDKVTHRLLKTHLSPNIVISNLCNAETHVPEFGEWFYFRPDNHMRRSTAFVTWNGKYFSFTQAHQRKVITMAYKENPDWPDGWERLSSNDWYFEEGVLYRLKVLKKGADINLCHSSSMFSSERAILDCLQVLGSKYSRQYKELLTDEAVYIVNNLGPSYEFPYITNTGQRRYIRYNGVFGNPLTRRVHIEHPKTGESVEWVINPNFLN